MTIHERSIDHLHNPSLDIGQRAWYLEEARKLETELGFSTSNFVAVPQRFFDDIGIDEGGASINATIDLVETSDNVSFRSPHPELTKYYAEQLRPHLPALQEQVESLKGDKIIVRPSPMDEHARPDLSFAGAYKGYMPLTPGDRDEHLLMGTAAMLAGRFTQYGNCYYDRHDIDGDRKVSAIYMEPFFELGHEIPLFYGTAYVAGDHIRNEYHISPPPDQSQRDPRLTVRRSGQTWHEDGDQTKEEAIDFTGRMERVLDGLQAHFKAPLDVEYIIDPKGDLYVVQIRKISTIHLAKWQSMPMLDEKGVEHRSAIIDSIGTVEGNVIDLRSSTQGISVSDISGAIAVINYEPKNQGIDSQTFFQLVRDHDLHGMRVVIDHGDSRLRDHLQYALAEDPGIDFIVQTTDPEVREKLQHGMYAQINSDGVTARVQELR